MPTGFDFVAIYAALVATGSLVFGVYQYVSGRRRKLDVDVRVGVVRHPSYGTRSIVSFRARNTGTLPVHVTQCGLAKTRRKKFRLTLEERLALPMPSFDLGSPAFPNDVDPHQTFTCFADLQIWCGNGLPQGHSWADYDGVYFVDGIGNDHVARTPAAFHADIERECAKVATQEETSE